MRVRIVQFRSKNPLVAIALLAAVLALLVFFLSAALAIAAGAALLGGVGFAVRGLRGGRAIGRGGPDVPVQRLDPANEVHERPLNAAPTPLLPESRER